MVVDGGHGVWVCMCACVRACARLSVRVCGCVLLLFFACFCLAHGLKRARTVAVAADLCGPSARETEN